jgi:TolB-like protein
MHRLLTVSTLVGALVAGMFVARPALAADGRDFNDLPAAIDAFAADVAAKTKGKNVAVAPFLPLGPNVREKRLGDVASELLATRLVQTGGPTVIERGQLDRILEETKLSLLGLTDASNASKVGQMLGADLVIVGSVSEVGDKVSVTVRAVETGTGEAQAAWEARFPASTVESLASKYVVKKSRGDAFFRSLIVPGWGQTYNGDDVKAGVFLGTAVVLVGLDVVEGIRFSNAQDDYRNAKTTPDALSGYDSMVNINREKTIAYVATGVFWAFNAAEAFINGTSSSEVKIESALPRNGGQGVALAYHF